jgi:hypothetical protein
MRRGARGLRSASGDKTSGLNTRTHYRMTQKISLKTRSNGYVVIPFLATSLLLKGGGGAKSSNTSLSISFIVERHVLSNLPNLVLFQRVLISNERMCALYRNQRSTLPASLPCLYIVHVLYIARQLLYLFKIKWIKYIHNWSS